MCLPLSVMSVPDVSSLCAELSVSIRFATVSIGLGARVNSLYKTSCHHVVTSDCAVLCCTVLRCANCQLSVSMVCSMCQ
jgi:hypothetical protein